MREYYTRKSPKAQAAKEKLLGRRQETGTQEKSQGAGNSPLLGDSGEPWPNTSPSKGQGSRAEERGRPGDDKGKKKALKALEKWPPDNAAPGKDPDRRKQVKRLQGTSTRKGKEAGNEGRGQVALLKNWLETGKGGLGPRKE